MVPIVSSHFRLSVSERGRCPRRTHHKQNIEHKTGKAWSTLPFYFASGKGRTAQAPREPHPYPRPSTHATKIRALPRIATRGGGRSESLDVPAGLPSLIAPRFRSHPFPSAAVNVAAEGIYPFPRVLHLIDTPAARFVRRYRCSSKNNSRSPP